MNRTKRIKTQLHKHFVDELELDTTVVTTQKWKEQLLPARFYGWAYPYETTEAYVIEYCPELIAEQTQTLSDEELDDYLLLIEYLIDASIAQMNIPKSGRITSVETQLMEINPSAFKFLSDVEMMMIDATSGLGNENHLL